METSRSLLLFLCLVTSSAHLVRRSDDGNPLATVVNGHSQTIAELQAKVQSLQASLARKAAFHARNPPSPVVKSTPMKFRVDVMVGEGYDQATGVYTVPYSGWYVVQTRLNVHDPASFHLDVHVNSVLASRFHCYNAVASSCTSEAILHLNAGDRVWVQTDDFSGDLWVADFDNMLSVVLVLPD